MTVLAYETRRNLVAVVAAAGVHPQDAAASSNTPEAPLQLPLALQTWSGWRGCRG
jgi:hypothetical protein